MERDQPRRKQAPPVVPPPDTQRKPRNRKEKRLTARRARSKGRWGYTGPGSKKDYHKGCFGGQTRGQRDA